MFTFPISFQLKCALSFLPKFIIIWTWLMEEILRSHRPKPPRLISGCLLKLFTRLAPKVRKRVQQKIAVTGLVRFLTPPRWINYSATYLLPIEKNHRRGLFQFNPKLFDCSAEATMKIVWRLFLALWLKALFLFGMGNYRFNTGCVDANGWHDSLMTLWPRVPSLLNFMKILICSEHFNS